MPQLFVSYAHKDEAFTKKFIEVVQNRYKNDPAVRVWYDRNLTGGVDWWKEIMRQLGKTDIFIYLMSQTALNSEYCQAEFREAYRLRKQIITVQVDANLDIDNDQLSAIQYVDLTHGLDHAEDRPQEGCLARTRRADDADELTAFDGERHVVDDDVVAVRARQMVTRDEQVVGRGFHDHCGYVALSVETSETSSASSADASPPRASIIVT